MPCSWIVLAWVGVNSVRFETINVGIISGRVKFISIHYRELRIFWKSNFYRVFFAILSVPSSSPFSNFCFIWKAGHILTHNEPRNVREINPPFFKNHFHLKWMTFNHCSLLLWVGYFPGYVFLKRFRLKLVFLISG